MLDRIRIVRACALALATACAVALAAQAADPQPGLTGTVNVNTATTEELQLRPGIGASRADALIELRKQRGGFKSLEQLKDVKGIGDASLERLRPYVRFEGKTTARVQ